jgi:hypothetical protein
MAPVDESSGRLETKRIGKTNALPARPATRHKNSYHAIRLSTWSQWAERPANKSCPGTSAAPQSARESVSKAKGTHRSNGSTSEGSAVNKPRRRPVLGVHAQVRTRLGLKADRDGGGCGESRSLT